MTCLVYILSITCPGCVCVAVAGIFTAARAMAPSVIFIDELDALAPARGRAEGSGGGTAPEPADEMSGRIVTTLLTAMDGINSGI